MNINEYVSAAKRINEELYREQSAAEVLMKIRRRHITDWNGVLQRGGYYQVTCGKHDWTKVHHWCRENVGNQHYTWTGHTFWFESDKDATMFALKWA